jgi:hypothetical protein
MACVEVAMSEWTDRLATALEVTSLDAGQEASILKASREIAHRVERRDTPLSTYLLGVAVGQRGSDPAALKQVLDAALALLPPEVPESD